MRAYWIGAALLLGGCGGGASSGGGSSVAAEPESPVDYSQLKISEPDDAPLVRLSD
ncbi:hypothetical protein [Gilvimarinus chinensis]|uniref:hypothetical protein n=1 Tax=Gilvimarinus chinensis TaxID=396005 RepID=UPI00037EF2F1|nr:hypothetical protein [Gilvimarinus chinensis]